MTPSDVPEIAQELPDQPEITALLSASDAYMAELYPGDSIHTLDIESMKGAAVTFLVARLHSQAVGCAALVDSAQGWVEIKRMFVLPEARAHGLGRRLLQGLEGVATEKGVALLRLETGIHQPEALKLYRSAGFKEIGPFNRYEPDPHSVFMEKRIDPHAPLLT